MADDNGEPRPDPSHLGERFQVRGLLGSGATASVYEAIDRLTGEEVALKVLHPQWAADPALAEAFLREAIIVEGVSHPGLCGLRARGDGRGAAHTWTAWELVRGLSLSETVRTSGPLDPRSALTVTGLLLDALTALHAAGIVHRDISPANVLVDRGTDGRVQDIRLVDFGLAAPIGESARGGDVLRSVAGDGVVGNASYASPEQLRGDPIGRAGDLYQVAGVLYYALVGTPPFPRAAVADTVQAHLTALPPTASVRVPGIPVALDRLIVRGMLKEPAERFPDAAAMRAAIDAVAHALAPGPVPRGVPDPVPPTRRPVAAPTRVLAAPVPVAVEVADERRTSPWLWVLAAAAVAMVVAVVTVVSRPAVSEPASAVTSAPAAEPTSPREEGASASPTPTVATSTPPAAPVLVRMPDIRGLGLADAVEALRREGLLPGELTTQDGTALAQTVVSGSAAPGVEVPAGGRIDLVVASGWNAVPDVVGYAEQDAIGRVSASGLIPVVVRESRPGIVGSVVDVQPTASTRQVLGSAVTLVVATAPAPTPSSTPRPTPTATSTPGSSE